MMEQTAEIFKKNFQDMCKKYNLPVTNKSIFFYTLSDMVMHEPDKKELLKLLITGICDNGYLLSHFREPQTSEENQNDFLFIQNNISKLYALLEKEYSLKREWEEIISRQTLPKINASLETDFTSFENETTKLAFLYRKYFQVSEKNSIELYNNLHRFICLTKSYPNYRKIAPFFFYQIMVKHSNRLAEKENLSISPKSLWEYKEYTIERNNHKNYKLYEQYGKLFRKLCKYFKKDVDVDISLCRYGFSHCSNLVDWFHHFEPEHIKKFESPLLYFLHKKAVTYWEAGTPDEFDICTFYHISSKEYWEFFEQIEDVSCTVEQTIIEYLQEYPEYLIDCMTYMYADAAKIHMIVEEVYVNADLEKLYPKDSLKKCRLSHTYEIMMQTLDIAIQCKIQDALQIFA